MTLALTLALALVVGLVLGLLGGGGSILMVPLLVYVAGLETRVAVATSLLAVGATSLAGLVAHARAGRVRWRTAAVLGAAGAAGAYVGGRVAELFPARVLLLAFAAMMASTAIAMLRGRRETEPVDESGEVPLLGAIATGAAVGLLTGFVGAGGGFLVVPALALLCGLAMPVAVGTSLVVIAMNSLGGLAGHTSSVALDWPFAVAVTSAAVAGSLVGGPLAGRLDPARLRRLFGWFVLAVAVAITLQQLD